MPNIKIIKAKEIQKKEHSIWIEDIDGVVLVFCIKKGTKTYLCLILCLSVNVINFRGIYKKNYEILIFYCWDQPLPNYIYSHTIFIY